MIRQPAAVLCFLGALALSGCAAENYEKRVRVTVDDARYPVSLSDYLLDSQGIVPPSGTHVVGRLHHEIACAPNHVDVSAVVNEQIAAHRGDALTGFAVTAAGDDDCMNLRIEGAIVSRSAR